MRFGIIGCMNEQTALLERIETLGEELNNRSEQITSLTELLAGRDAQIRRMQAQLNELLKRLYGRKSEKLDPHQLLLQDVLLQAESAQPAAKDDSAAAAEGDSQTEVAAHTRKKRKQLELPEHLNRVEHLLDVASEDKTCDCCQQTMSEIGRDITERIAYQPVQLQVNRYIRPKYACKNPLCSGIESAIKQAPAKESPLGRCEAESSLLAHIITEKFEHHNPLYRQEDRFERLGLGLTRMTMCCWLAKSAYVLGPLYRLMVEETLAGDIVHNDDTPVGMLEPGNGKTRTARLWVTVGGRQMQYTVYNFTKGRGREGPEEFFKNYQGYFVADAYGGYVGLFESDRIIHIGCWAHARRYFITAQESSPRQATESLVLIAKLYHIEAGCKQSRVEERLAVRQKQSVKTLEKIKATLLEQRPNALPRSALGEAIEYTLRQWESLQRYTTDGRLPIDNNPAEQAMRPPALGRKNWLFVGSENGGHTAAVLMSFCATCRKLNINTWEYLKDVLDKINDWPQKRLAELLPDNWQRARAKVNDNLPVL